MTPEDAIRAMVDRETSAWNRQDADALVDLFHPDMVWPWPPESGAHDPASWVFPYGRFNRARWKALWSDLFATHDLVHNNRQTVRIEVSTEGDGGFAVVDVDTMWRRKADGAPFHWKGRACKGYTKVGDRWLLILHTGLLEYSPEDPAVRHGGDRRHAASGFGITEGVLAAHEAEALAARLQGVPRTRAGARHLMALPEVAAVARDSRLVAIAKEWLGGAAIPFKATLFDKSPGGNWLVTWHQDTALPLRQQREAPGWGPWSVKSGVTYAKAPASALEGVVALRLHLDDCGPDNGPLRVLPGTHASGVLDQSSIHRLASTVEPVDCLVRRGGVIAMRPLLVHASTKAIGSAPRRVLHIEYARSLNPAPGLEVHVA